MAKVAIIYYSSTGHTHALAEAVEAGAKEAGAETRLRRVAELAPEAVVAKNPDWAAHLAATAGVPEASLDDLEWADGYVFGTPVRYGLPAAQLKQFIDTTGPLWAQGKLADKVVSGFCGAMNPHGGQESTLLALYNTFYHWGSIIVPVGYTDPVTYASGGNPYGPSYTTGPNNAPVPEPVLATARYLGGRVARFAARLAG